MPLASLASDRKIRHRGRVNTRLLAAALFTASFLLCSPPALTYAQDDPKDKEAPNAQEKALIQQLRDGDWDAVIAATDKTIDSASPGDVIFQARSQALQQRGQERFFGAEIKGSIADFDGYLKLFPERDPHHWQRGISYYYAEQYEKGKAQFERHQDVNSQDVENAVWHFLCAVRAPGGNVEAARKEFININADGRVPMKQIHALFEGSGDEAAVINAASNENAGPEGVRNHLCYAHLYLGLYHEALGNDEKAEAHMRKAAVDYRMEHYMGKVAQVHARLRGWTEADEAASPNTDKSADSQNSHYSSKTPSRDGIGKIYMGREISQVVGHGAVRWLERPERETEEAPSKVIENMELKPTDVVADIGAGSGYFSFLLADLVPDGKVLAVDIQQEMLNFIEGQKKLKKKRNVETVLGTIEDTKLPEGEVDAIIMVDAYHEFSHPFEMATSMAKGLRPGGRIILIEYRGEDPEVQIKPLHKMTEQQCIREMKAVGMEHVETRDFLPIQHFMIFQKPVKK